MGTICDSPQSPYVRHESLSKTLIDADEDGVKSVSEKALE